ncbi:relaxase/mobilization nuclease domain-containing protein [Novosphingobium sp. SG707]|uniref:relaxase/mobilization nuclease domain-containing protein n=1 Tax=Novosphingobium sp. SG707 TaxID=2586996 RepID=UPI001FF0B1FC|nr:relaxase/mobilization nuclease domain-containing protein [Novosphingobium sp. SG707]
MAAVVAPRSAPVAASLRPARQIKHAFGGGSHAAVSGRAIAAMERTARRVPEVMVRATGRQHGGGHVLANFSYISRLGHGEDKQVALYTSDEEMLHDARDMQILAQDWQEWEMGGDARRNGATSISMILSMPAGTVPERLRDAALDFAREEFANRSWVAALHVDRDHPHVHLTIARRDHDGRRFHPNRDDFFRYRQRFAEKLRDRGIEANATPARARGIDPRHEPIAARKVREKGEVPRVDKSRAERAQRLRESGVGDPVDAVLAAQQAIVRRAYERSIEELSASSSLADQVIARSLEKFVATMPVPEANSARATRVRDVSADPHERPLASSKSGSDVDTLDPLSAALARSRDMREGIRSKAAPASTDDLNPVERQSRTGPDLERLRALLDQANQSHDQGASKPAEETLRRVQERDREQRERDRSRNRDGPER